VWEETNARTAGGACKQTAVECCKRLLAFKMPAASKNTADENTASALAYIQDACCKCFACVQNPRLIHADENLAQLLDGTPLAASWALAIPIAILVQPCTRNAHGGEGRRHAGLQKAQRVGKQLVPVAGGRAARCKRRPTTDGVRGKSLPACYQV
jgi:hypothetical protein